MHILRTHIDDIELQHLEELIAMRARESEVLEFKATLPFQAQKGQPQQADRWIEKGDRIGEYARDQILSEIVAFANSNGGTLILGVRESEEQPREAIALSPLPRCEALAQRLLNAAEDIIEPRVLSLASRGLPVDRDGNGYVVLRVGRSRSGPHRLNGQSREFYVRRGERASRMDVREIKSLTLELARSGDRIEAELEHRRNAAREKFFSLPARTSDREWPGFLIRSSAIPTLSVEIECLTNRPEFWWQGQAFDLQFDQGEIVRCSYPSERFFSHPKIRLRSFADEYDKLARLLRHDGLCEAVLAHPPRALTHEGATPCGRIYVAWIAGLIVSLLCQVEHFRRIASWDTVEFGLEFEVWSASPIKLLWHERCDGVGIEQPTTGPLRFPLYSIRQFATFDDLLNQVMQDLFNAWGGKWTERCHVDWEKLIPIRKSH